MIYRLFLRRYDDIKDKDNETKFSLLVPGALCILELCLQAAGEDKPRVHVDSVQGFIDVEEKEMSDSGHLSKPLRELLLDPYAKKMFSGKMKKFYFLPCKP